MIRLRSKESGQEQFPSDITYMIKVCSDAGYNISRNEVELAWMAHSQTASAGWLIVGENSDYIVEKILAQTVTVD